jgi:hypothetical protein
MSGAEKRGIADTSIDQNSSFEVEANKKSKINEMNKTAKEVSIMILDGGIKYSNNPSELKKDLVNCKLNNMIKETKITVSNHLIIIFIDETGREEFEKVKSTIFMHNEIIDLNKKKPCEIIIKGLNYKTINSYSYELSKIGIKQINQMMKSNENFRMIRAECTDNDVKEKLIKEGIKIDHFSLKVEDYKRPIRPLQCFNCQKFDHVATNCPDKNKPVCLKCGGDHIVKVCTSDEVKCANCNLDHTSSYKGCLVFQAKLEEKLKKLNVVIVKPTSGINSRSYSQVTNNSDDLEELKKSIIEGMKSIILTSETTVLNEIKLFKEEIHFKINNIQNDLNLYKAKQLFYNIDILKVVFNVNINDDHIKKILELAKNHGIENINQHSLISYCKKKPINNNEYKSIKYLNV